jgi:two-component system, cell cycle sensor histidine kinase and response regulator CckA
VKLGQKMLNQLGYSVETKRNPIEALDLVRSEPDRFDLVITDMTMPQMTGDKLAKEILSIRPDMPIIL